MALILAADHSETVLQTLVQPLSSLKHEVVTASSVVKAMEWLNASHRVPDLIIADVGLRSFQGLEFIHALKASAKWAGIPILVQTRGTQCEIFEHCESTLMKPYSSRELIHAVNLVLAPDSKSTRAPAA
jgi:CheY-like chemotaxis protein